MVHQAAAAYGRTAQATQSPRELEAGLLLKSAQKLQSVREDWEGRRGDLDEALTYNRKLWIVLIGTVSREDNPMPLQVRQNIASLGAFILNRSLDMMLAPAPEKLGALIDINRELAAGLRARPSAAAPIASAA